MKIAVMNTYDNEGGAARCANRLHRGLIQRGIDSTYFVQKKFGAEGDVITFHHPLTAEFRPGVDRLPLRMYRHRRRAPFSTGLLNPLDIRPVTVIHPDIVNLHYVGEGFLPIRALGKVGIPLVWTLHDSWPFTGGCHLPGDCTSYRDMCGNCPILGSGSSVDLSRWIMKRKSVHWQHLDIVVVAGSQWIAECARMSSLFSTRRIEVIHPGLNLNVYSPVERGTARTILSLPKDIKLILFGAINSTTDPNKGFHILQSAINLLAKSTTKAFEVVVFGANKPSPAADFGVPSHYMGRLHDDVSLALLYGAADVMVVPSLSESFGQTATEAMACGTPVVAFGATGLLDIVTHQHNGYLAEPYDHLDLARGIDWILSRDHNESRALSANARKTAISNFSIETMTTKYIDLFEDVLSHSGQRRTNGPVIAAA